MNVRILCIGDVVGATGRALFAKHIQSLKSKYKIDFIIVNGENSADDGRGITPKVADFFKEHGVTVITSGNHIWAKKEIYSYIADHKDFLLRPANFPSEVPGVGVTIISGTVPIAVINVQGRVFMKELLDCPFKTTSSLLTYIRDKARVIIVDFHAETTAEKAALAYYLDGKISALFGTHTHVQTADERILPQGTAFITDVGMVGARDSSLGMKKEPIIQALISQMPVRFQVETEGPGILNGIVIEVDGQTGKALSISRVVVNDEQPAL
jgi:hypothetical protein